MLNQHGISFLYDNPLRLSEGNKSVLLHPGFYLPESGTYVEYFSRVGIVDYEARIKGKVYERRTRTRHLTSAVSPRATPPIDEPNSHFVPHHAQFTAPPDGATIGRVTSKLLQFETASDPSAGVTTILLPYHDAPATNPHPPTRNEKNNEPVSPPFTPRHHTPQPRPPPPKSHINRRHPQPHTRPYSPPANPTHPPLNNSNHHSHPPENQTNHPTQTPKNQTPHTTKAWAQKRSRNYRCPLPKKTQPSKPTPKKKRSTIEDRVAPNPS